MLDSSKLAYFKEKLEKEKALLERELKTVGRINPENPADWQPTPAVMDILNSDDNEVADSIEEFESNVAILKQLEIRFNEVKEALSRMEKEEYGKCRIGGEDIEEERLEANPAATTCLKHIGK